MDTEQLCAGRKLPREWGQLPDYSTCLPERLLKFTDPRGLGILVNGELKITPPREFNDPAEFSPAIPPEPTTQVEREEHLLTKDGNARRVWQKGDEEGYRAWVATDPLGAPGALTEYSQKLRDVIRDNFGEFFGVACFSEFEMESADAVRHWAIYGGNHTGLAIEFDGTHEWFQEAARERFFFKIGYEPKRPKCTLREFNARTFEDQLMVLRRWGSVKSKAWEPEQEWRLIFPLQTKQPDLMRRVIDGERIVYLLRLWNPSFPTLAGC